jgi:hypothetical protein
MTRIKCLRSTLVTTRVANLDVVPEEKVSCAF